MYRDIPVFNRPIIERIQKQNQQKHLQRLMNIKTFYGSKNLPNVRNTYNRKAALEEQHKKTQIQKQNIFLFNRMMSIMKRQDPNNNPNNHTTHSSHKTRNSVNFQKIQQQNISLFQRLDQQKPTINNKKFQEDRAKKLTILKFLGKYPNPNAQRFWERKKQFQSQQKSRTNDADLQQQYCQDQLHQYMGKNQGRPYFKYKNIQQSRKRFSSHNYNHQKDQEYQNSISFKKNLEPNLKQKVTVASEHRNNNLNHQINLYSTSINISNYNMQVQIIRNYNDYQFIASENSQPKYCLKLSQNQGNNFFLKYDYNYKQIVSFLKIQQNELVIREEQQQQDLHRIQEKTEQQVALKSNNIVQNIKENQGLQWDNYQQALDQQVD